MEEIKNRIKSIIKKQKKLLSYLLFPIFFLNRRKNYLAWKLFRMKVSRNQWRDKKKWKIYEKVISDSLDILKSTQYPYFIRLNFVLERAKGEVLDR